MRKSRPIFVVYLKINGFTIRVEVNDGRWGTNITKASKKGTKSRCISIMKNDQANLNHTSIQFLIKKNSQGWIFE
jgi:hypothetical protein